MEDLFKKFMYTGVGLVSLTADKLQKSIDKLVKEEKISAKEGKKIVEDFFKKTESKRRDFETQLKKTTEEVVKKFDFSKAKEILELNKRVRVLENKVAKMSQTTKTTRKAPTKRTVKKATVKK
ncbi:MAG: phasin family protein [Cyclobacteriaceae bacterium]